MITNVLLYLVDVDEVQKQAKANALLSGIVAKGSAAVLLWQVAVEFSAGLSRWQNLGKLAAHERIGHWQRVESTFPLVLRNPT